MKPKHMLWMLIGCTVPLLFIFLAPLFGITGNWALLLFIIAMFACHLLMPMDHHGSHGSGHEKHLGTNKSKDHEHH